MVSNLGDIIARVKHELRGLPNVQKTRDNLRQLATEVQREIVEEHPYPFMRETRQVVLLPDVELTNMQCSLYEDAGNSTLRVFATTRQYLAAGMGIDDGDVPEAGAELLERLNGATFDLADRTLRDDGDGNWAVGPFEVYNAGIASTSLGVVFLYLDDRASIDSITGDEGDYVIRFPRLLLDPSISEVLWLRERATGAADLRAISTRDGLTLEENRAGDPAVWWMDDGFRPRFGPGGVTATGFAPLSVTRSINASLGRQAPVPINSTAAAGKFTPGGITIGTTTGGTLPVGKYKVMFSWLIAGRLSPPTEALSVTIADATNDAIQITGAPQHPLGVTWHGWRRTAWMSYNDGPFYLVQGGTPLGSTASTPAASPPSSSTETILSPINPSAQSAIRWDDAYAGGQHRYLVIWPRPTVVKFYEMGVTRRPRALIEDTDTPHLPIEFNDLIVWEMCARIAAVQNADSETARECRKIADRRLNALKSKFGMNRAVRHQRQPLGGSNADFGDRFELTVDYRAD